MALSRKEIGERYRQRHPDRIKECQRKYRENNPDRIKETVKKYRSNNMDKIRKRNSEYQKNHRDIINAKTRRWRLNHPEFVEIDKKNDILFKGKSITLKENPRKGQCMMCLRKLGEGVKRTVIHHIQYHDDDPLKDTIELCESCHAKEHKRLAKRE